MKKIDPRKSITDVVMFDGASDVQLAGELLNIHYPKVSVIRGVEHNVSLFSMMFLKFQLCTRLLKLIRK